MKQIGYFFSEFVTEPDGKDRRARTRRHAEEKQDFATTRLVTCGFSSRFVVQVQLKR